MARLRNRTPRSPDLRVAAWTHAAVRFTLIAAAALCTSMRAPAGTATARRRANRADPGRCDVEHACGPRRSRALCGRSRVGPADGWRSRVTTCCCFRRMSSATASRLAPWPRRVTCSRFSFRCAGTTAPSAEMRFCPRSRSRAQHHSTSSSTSAPRGCRCQHHRRRRTPVRCQRPPREPSRVVGTPVQRHGPWTAGAGAPSGTTCHASTACLAGI